MATVTRPSPRESEPVVDDEPAIPPLESGDRLSRDEFERRYHAMPEQIRAELIEGVVYVASPVSRKHGVNHYKIIGWTFPYTSFTPGIEGADNSTVRLDLDNEPQPDVLLRIAPDHGGRSRTSDDDYIEGAPEFVAEVAASSASYDLHDKLNAYRRNGILEYLVWRVRDKAVDWFVWREGRYVLKAPSDEGILKSDIFPGLWLDPAALLRGDTATVLQVVQQGLASPEHAAFVEKLKVNAARIAASRQPEAPLP